MFSSLFGSRKSSRSSRSESGSGAAPPTQEEEAGGVSAFRQASDGKLLASAAANAPGPSSEAPAEPKRRARRPSQEEIQSERRNSLGGRLPMVDEDPKAAIDHIISGILPLADAFDKFDVDQSDGLTIDEVKSALEYLGVGHNSSEQAHKILLQYDNYPDRKLDVKEFSALCRDLRMMVKFDANGDGVLDASELGPALQSIGLRLSPAQITQAVQAFDADGNGSIDLLELSHLVRTARAFVRYDTDKSGAIELEEMQEALRRLGVCAGALEAKTLFRRYDADGSGSIELHEFAALVRDLQLYAAYDENFDGEIDASELHKLLVGLGLSASAEMAAELLRAATAHASAVASGGGGGGGGGGGAAGDGAPPPTTGLGLARFSNLVNELRTFRKNDADADGALTLAEARAALGALGLGGAAASDGDLDALLGAGARSRGRVTVVEFVEAVTATGQADGMAATGQDGDED